MRLKLRFASESWSAGSKKLCESSQSAEIERRQKNRCGTIWRSTTGRATKAGTNGNRRATDRSRQHRLKRVICILTSQETTSLPIRDLLRLRKSTDDKPNGQVLSKLNFRKRGDGDRSQGCSDPQVGHGLKIKRFQCADLGSLVREGCVNSQ